MEQWQVDRSCGKCAGTGIEFVPGQEYYAALLTKDDTFERVDYSCQYWDQQQPEVFCFWKTKVPVKEKKKKLLVDDAVLKNVFERLENEQEALKINFRFVLALILMRKRILKYEDTKIDGTKELWRMKMVRDPRMHEVINPHLDDEQIETVSSELSTILNGEI